MVKTFQAYLPECHRTYSCIHCRAHLANHDELISKSFQGSQGRAYLFNSVVNVGCGPAEERVLLTGLHAVADIYCECCKTTLGWKYEHAFESSQKYKEGKYIIELAHMIKENGWDNWFERQPLIDLGDSECSLKKRTLKDLSVPCGATGTLSNCRYFYLWFIITNCLFWGYAHNGAGSFS